jgi:GntP family gluconate:H+ symporter
VIVVGGILFLRLHAFLALLLAALAVAVLTPTSALESFAAARVEDGQWTQKTAAAFVRSTAAARVAQGFGETCGKIGILIAMASIIGKCLLDSGAADRIVRSILRWVGQQRAPVAFVGSGFLLGIPVFFDTVFYLMIPLGKAMRLRTGGHYVLYILTIVAGGTMAHSLVPPTPGPLYVAEQLQINLALMIAAGCLIGLASSSAGCVFAYWIDRRLQVPLRESPDFSLADMEALMQREETSLPPFWLAVLPILLPVGLIAARTAAEAAMPADGSSSTVWSDVLRPMVLQIGDKNVALILAAGIALGVLVRQLKHQPRQAATAVQSALAGGGIIILITSAGGALGGVIRQCGIAEQIADWSEGIPPLWILPLAFLVTTLIRTAQGSATVAMITAVSVLEHFATSGQLAFHPVYLALAIGCGSKPVAWMNDSGFWVICKMSGMTEIEGLKTVTPMSVIMGIAGLLATLLAAWLVPLV